MGVITIKSDFSAFSLPPLSRPVFSALILPALIFLYSLDHSCHALLHYYIPLVPSNIVGWFPLPPLPRSGGCSLLSGLLRAPLQPVVSAVCAQHRAVSSCHWPLWVPVRLLWLSVQPRQVAFCVPLTFTYCFSYCQLIHCEVLVTATGKNGKYGLYLKMSWHFLVTGNTKVCF